ncbi:hypothetical protein MJ524_18270 [Escherichia coli]|nr:hypothetical protein MJ524_18270 [Escherichia coli]
METKKNNSEYIPEFDKSFRHLRYWGAWLGVAAMAGIALTPPKFRDPILGTAGTFGADAWEKAQPPSCVNQFVALLSRT